MSASGPRGRTGMPLRKNSGGTCLSGPFVNIRCSIAFGGH
ncbi:hypothetical protein THTE_0412 [Thermogutta terrifontis]|uniref:Uncharacterized protein n=1 Tax=Thermogutta terrifontis TaxID=1331910 RepID=A0A286RAL9_9BACT|nr:hypothetical protein THTE_0412 [Thermogutta terrifontis]